jgi:hypothetical protein
MKMKAVLAVAALVGLFAVPAQAVTISGQTDGCFGLNCAATAGGTATLTNIT